MFRRYVTSTTPDRQAQGRSLIFTSTWSRGRRSRAPLRFSSGAFHTNQFGCPAYLSERPLLTDLGDKAGLGFLSDKALE
jgi:hypothetical protein